MSIAKQFGKRIIISDGAMGTMLLTRGMEAGTLPELFNFTNPDVVTDVHRAYFQAGSDFVSVNAFGANAPKMEGTGYTVEQVICQAVSLARKAAEGFDNKYVAMSVGSLGILMEPMGPLTFEKAYEIFKEIAVSAKKADADFIIFETFTDIYEMKAAITAAKENTDLPIVCSLTFEANGRMLMGADPLTAVNIIQDMGIDALGVNCSLGPLQLLPVVKEILQYCRLPVIVQPNAGLPQVTDEGDLLYDIGIDEYVEAVCEMIKAGVSIVGGCCGTDPAYIRSLAECIRQMDITARPEAKSFAAASSAVRTRIIQEDELACGQIEKMNNRINVMVNEELKQALVSDNMSYIAGEARKAGKSGAELLEICIDIDGVEKEALMNKVVKTVSQSCHVPICLISNNKELLDKVSRRCNGRPLIKVL